MEYSPMMVVMLWALTPSDCWPTGSGSGEQARVVEMPQPVMSVHPEGGYFTFNHGRPFLAERDPLTGAIDSNIKTTPVTSDDYLYEEYEETGESIDRKDSTKIYTRNDITSPSKDSDLHKFLNLPVHYSSSGKYPLISSSYANTKVQGHGPLSNHKLYTSSTSTTTTVSPSYYPLKTTPASTTTARTTTSKATTLTTTTTTATTTTTTNIPTSTQKSTTLPPATRAPTTKAPLPLSTTIKTTTLKPSLLPMYEYEYDYDYDKNEGEATEKTSNDYEFLGASSEITKLNEKPSMNNPSKPSSTSRPVPNITESLTPTSMSTSFSTTTSKSVPTLLSVEHTSNSEMKQSIILSADNKREEENTSKIPESSTVHQEDVLDLKPPKPELSVDLRPPHPYPNRPYSSVVSKPQNFGHQGYIRYPETPLMIEDKKPINVYLPQNDSKIKPETISTLSSEQLKLNNSPQEENKNSKTPSRIDELQPNQKVSINKPSNIVTSSVPNQGSIETVSKNESMIRKPSLQSNNFTNNQEKPQRVPSFDTTPQMFSVSHHNSPLDNRPFRYNPSEVANRPVAISLNDKQRPQDSIENNREELFVHQNPQGVMMLKPEYRPQEGLPEHSKLQGVQLTGHNRPPQELRPNTPIQGHAKPSSPQENTNLHGASSSENKKIQRPQSSLPDNSRLQINLKPDNRPPSTHLSHNNKPFIYYPSPEHTRPSNYHQVPEHNHPANNFGLRINERPSGTDIPPGKEPVRSQGVMKPQMVQNEQKKPSIGLEMRPHQGVIDGEMRPGDNNQRPEGSTKPVIFSKPQSGKRPDYNTVQFGQPSKVENHFISVSPGHDSPSYSLQTSFSIGVPPPEQKQPSSGVHGVGQVLFPDEEPEKRPPPIWPQQRPPQIVQPDSQPNIQVEKYPRPPWETHLKPPHMYHKKEHYPPIKRKPLPNILPQFRPNAKIGHAEPHVYLKPREPYDTLQPPPLPRPQFLRYEPDIEETKPLVHRRNGQTSSRVTTLQMMQGPPAAKRAALRIDDSNEKNEPVFVVYPSNGNSIPPPPPSDGVVVGTRGSQRPLPPDNLDVNDDLDSFPLDNNKNFQTRVDTPVLKGKPPTPKPLVKNDFPYALIKPNPEERITPGSIVTKEYTAFSPTVPSTEHDTDHDTEINIIPYLQDYMPFATKKPPHKDTWHLNTDVKHASASIGSKPTPLPHKNENHRVVVSDGPQPQDFQAPFHASLTAPSQGWSVVQKKPNKEKINEEITTTKDINDIQTTEEPKFDIQNFKPQLFGGFKPIVPPVENENKENLPI